jgi:hypothetical protein
MKRLSSLKAVVVLLSLTLSGAVMAQQTGSSMSAHKTQVNAGQKMKVKGVVIKRDVISFLLKDHTGSEL